MRLLRFCLIQVSQSIGSLGAKVARLERRRVFLIDSGGAARRAARQSCQLRRRTIRWPLGSVAAASLSAQLHLCQTKSQVASRESHSSQVGRD